MRPSLHCATGLVLVASSLLLIAPAAQAADGCASGVPMDFNGDGYSDAAIANSTATEAGQVGAGRITIRYGNGDGRVGEGAAQNIRADTGFVSAGVVQPGAAFGSSVATADLDCDGYADLVVGAPMFDNPGAVDSGNVTMLYGDSSGFTASSAQHVLDSENFGASLGAGDRFGFAVDAVEDLGQGGTPAPDAYGIIVGIPYRNAGGVWDSGAVAAKTAIDGGTNTQWIDQETPGVPGGSATGDRFGYSVTFGQFDSAGTIDVLVGAPYEDVGSSSDAGAVTRLDDLYGDEFGSASWMTQDSSGVPDTVEKGDEFGRVVDAYTSGSSTRVAIAAPNEDIGSTADAGAVNLYSRSGSTLTPGILLNQDTSGVGGAAEKKDYFGSDVSIGPGFYLAVGDPGEDASAVDCGPLQLFPVANVPADVAYTQATAGVPGTAKAGERLGSSVALIDGSGENVALAGVPADVENAGGLVNVFPYASDSPRSWSITGSGGGFGDGFGSQGR